MIKFYYVNLLIKRNIRIAVCVRRTKFQTVLLRRILWLHSRSALSMLLRHSTFIIH